MSSKPTTQCKKCNLSISLCNIQRHEQACNGYQSSRKNGKQTILSFISHLKEVDGKWSCNKCPKIHNTRAKMAIHYWRCHTIEDGAKVPNPLANRKIVHNQFTSGKESRHRESTKAKLSAASRANPAGVALHPHLRSGAGNSKHYLVHDSNNTPVTLQSSWEYELYLDLERNAIKWRRPAPFWLTLKNKCGRNSSYTPDFWLVDYDVYLDPKARENIEQSKRIEYWSIQYQKKLLIIRNKNDLNWDYISTQLELE